jgi:hypothetical protein
MKNGLRGLFIVGDDSLSQIVRPVLLVFSSFDVLCFVVSQEVSVSLKCGTVSGDFALAARNSGPSATSNANCTRFHSRPFAAMRFSNHARRTKPLDADSLTRSLLLQQPLEIRASAQWVPDGVELE